MNSSTFANLNSLEGSAIYSTNPYQSTISMTVGLYNSLMANNSAVSQGGVIQVTDVNFEVVNSTIANNSAETSGGAFYLSCSL